MKTIQEFLIESQTHGLEDVSHYSSVAGTQYGSNSGGIHHDQNGDKHYIKFYKNPEQARVEYATHKIYQHMGINTLDNRLVHSDGRIGLASKFKEGLSNLGYGGEKHLDEEGHKQVVKGYIGAALMKNWDHVGLEQDNIVKDQHGKVHSVDQGGSMHFRAQGGHKDFDSDVSELHSLRKFEPSATVFNHSISKVGLSHGLDSLKQLQYHHVVGAIRDAGLPDHLADTIWQRRSNILKAHE